MTPTPDIDGGKLPANDLIRAIPRPGEPTEYGTTPNAVTAPLEIHPDITPVLDLAAGGEPKSPERDGLGDFLRPIL